MPPYDELRLKRAQKLLRLLTEAVQQADDLGYADAIDFLLKAKMVIVRRAADERDRARGDKPE